MKIKQVKENTLKMIRNNERYEDCIHELLLYARDKQDLEMAKIIEKFLKQVEYYEGL